MVERCTGSATPMPIFDSAPPATRRPAADATLVLNYFIGLFMLCMNSL